MNIFKVIEIIGLFLQVFSGFLFLLEFVMQSWGKSLNKSINKTEELLSKLLVGRWFLPTLILLVIVVAIWVYMYFVSKLQGASLSDIGLPNLIIGIIVGAAIAGFVYALSLRFSLWLAKKWEITKKFLAGSLFRRFIVLNAFLFFITLVPFIILTLIFNLFTVQHPLIFLLIGLLFTIFGGLAAVSLLIIIIFLLLRLFSFATSSPRKFWTSLLIMWSIGGVCLLYSAIIGA